MFTVVISLSLCKQKHNFIVYKIRKVKFHYLHFKLLPMLSIYGGQSAYVWKGTTGALLEHSHLTDIISAFNNKYFKK